MKKKLVSFISLTLAVFMLSSCGIGTTKKDVAGKDITIKIGMWPGENDKHNQEVYNNWKVEYEKKYPNIKIIPESYSYDPKTFIAKAESGQLPNMISTWYTEPSKIIKAGYAADITEIVKQWGYDKKYDQKILSICKDGDKIYGLPKDIYQLGLWCNVELFKQAGLVDEAGIPLFPKTFDELALIASKIKQKTGKDGMFIPSKDHNGGWHYNNIAWNFGAEMEQNINGKWTATFNSAEGLSALQYIYDLKWKYNALSDNALLGWSDFLKNFSTNQVAMVLGAVDSANLTVNSYGMSKDNFAICSIPAGPKGKISQLGGNVIMFSKNTTPEQVDACLKWLEFTGYTPNSDSNSLKGLEDRLKADFDKNNIVFAQQLSVWSDPQRKAAEVELRKKYTNVNSALHRDYFENTEVTIKPEAPYNGQDLYGIMDNVIQKILSDKTAEPKKLIDGAAKEFQTDYLDNVKSN